MIDEYIEYYLNGVKKLNVELAAEKEKLLEYEQLVMTERISISKKSLMARLFSGQSKFIRDLDKLIKNSKQTISSINYRIQEQLINASKLGTKELYELSEAVLSEQKLEKECIRVITNIEHIISVLKILEKKSRNAMDEFEHSMEYTGFADKNNYLKKAFIETTALILSANDLKQYLMLNDFLVISQDQEKSFSVNLQGILNNILKYEKKINTTALANITMTFPYITLMEHSKDILDSIYRNITVMTSTCEQKLTELRTLKTNVKDKLSTIEVNCQTIFMNKLRNAEQQRYLLN